MHGAWPDWAQGHGRTGQRGPSVRVAWLDRAQGPILHMASTRGVAGLAGLQDLGHSSCLGTRP